MPLFGPALAGLTEGLAERAECARLMAPLYLALHALFTRLIASLDRLVALHNAGLLPPLPEPAATALALRTAPPQGRKSHPWWQFWRTTPVPAPSWSTGIAVPQPFPHTAATRWQDAEPTSGSKPQAVPTRGPNATPGPMSARMSAPVRGGGNPLPAEAHLRPDKSVPGRQSPGTPESSLPVSLFVKSPGPQPPNRPPREKTPLPCYLDPRAIRSTLTNTDQPSGLAA